MDLSYPKNGTGVDTFVPEDHYFRNKVELVFPKINDFVPLINSKGLVYVLLVTMWLVFLGKIISF
jgi:hypothetical protein